MSLTARRPPGLSTRAISRKTAGLSGARLMTQLLMTTVDRSVRERQAVDGRQVELDVVVRAAFEPPRGVAPRQLDHLGRHVDADGAPRRPDLLRGQKHVEPAARPEVDDHLALAQEAVAVGFPHESPMLASAGMDASSSAV